VSGTSQLVGPAPNGCFRDVRLAELGRLLPYADWSRRNAPLCSASGRTQPIADGQGLVLLP
jgi:hypothetical protein